MTRHWAQCGDKALQHKIVTWMMIKKLSCVIVLAENCQTVSSKAGYDLIRVMIVKL